MILKKEIKNIFYSLQADVCGIANIERFKDAPKGFSPTDIFRECKSVIVFGAALPKGLERTDSRLIYGHFNNMCTGLIDEIAFFAAKRMEREFSCTAIPVPCDGPYEYWDEEKSEGRGLISMKHAAALAGIGSIGNNSLLINERFGTMLTIGAVLTDLELNSDEECEELCIKGCSKCIDSCPVGAIHNKTVNQKLCRNNTFGKTKRGFDTVECNKCRVVCPLRYGKQRI